MSRNVNLINCQDKQASQPKNRSPGCRIPTILHVDLWCYHIYTSCAFRYKRAEWKWAVDRAAIVSRWTWLQAQVSDLEYRIRQQSEIHKTIRASKGGVTLGEMPTPTQYGIRDASTDKKQEVSPVNISSLLINVNRQASKLTQSLGNCYSPIQSSSTLTSDKARGTQPTPKALNGFVDGSHTPLTSTPNTSHSMLTDACRVTSYPGPSGDNASAYASPDLNQPLDITCQAARCRPLASYRKRKLLRTAGLHQVNHKAARLSSVRCQCYPPVMSCPMCGGRYNNFQRVDAEGMPVTEKVSLIDSSFHPVLSFPEGRLGLCEKGRGNMIWATAWQNQQKHPCAQQTHISLGIKPVWAESLLSIEHTAKTLIRLGGCPADPSLC